MDSLSNKIFTIFFWFLLRNGSNNKLTISCGHVHVAAHHKLDIGINCVYMLASIKWEALFNRTANKYKKGLFHNHF